MDVDLTGLIKLIGVFPIGPAATEYGMRPSPEVEGEWPPKEWKTQKQEGAVNIGAVRTEFPPAGNTVQQGPQKIWPSRAVPLVGHGFWGRELEETLRALKQCVIS